MSATAAALSWDTNVGTEIHISHSAAPRPILERQRWALECPDPACGHYSDRAARSCRETMPVIGSPVKRWVRTEIRPLFVGVQPLSRVSAIYRDVRGRAANASSRYWLPHLANRCATQMRSSSSVLTSLRIVLNTFIPACGSAVCN
jgi:hypothetical protein